MQPGQSVTHKHVKKASQGVKEDETYQYCDYRRRRGRHLRDDRKGTERAGKRVEPAGTPPDRLRGSKDRIRRSDGQAYRPARREGKGVRKHRRNQRILEAAKKLCAAAGIFAGLMLWGTMGELETGDVIPLKTLAAMLVVETAAMILAYMAYQTLDAMQDWENKRYMEERRKRHGRNSEIRRRSQDIC